MAAETATATVETVVVTETETTTTTVAPDVPAQPEYKVFAGNLAFSTTEDDLKKIFAEVGNVTNAQIIMRGTRSLGYGFVTFTTEADANKAVEALDKKEIDGRPINVEVAKPQDEKPAKQPKAKSKKKKAATSEDAEGKEDTGEEGAEGEKKKASKAKAKAKGRGTRGGRASRRPRTDADAEDGTGDVPSDQGAGTEGEEGARGKGGRRGRGGKVKTGERPKRQPKGEPEGEPSKTLLFVANLPFNTTDEQLAAAFEGFSLSSAKVVKRRFGTRSKGFGFVDFKDEAEQQRALQEKQGAQLEGRELALKIAIGQAPKPAGEEGANGTGAAEGEEKEKAAPNGEAKEGASA